MKISLTFTATQAARMDNIMGWGMLGGEHSTLINNGTVNVTGNGSTGAQVRALTTEHSYVTNINNGIIYIDVEKSFMSRALATTGNYGSLINNGTIFNRTNSVVYGMSEPSVGTFVNNGKITAISYG